MSWKLRVFITITAALGVIRLASDAISWRWSEPKLFLLYIAVAVVCSYFQVKSANSGMAFSVNIPVIIISIVRLNLTEAILVGCVAVLSQTLWDRHSRSRKWQMALNASILSTVIATASFAYESLTPHLVQSMALRLLVASMALFFANTFASAIATRLNDGEHRVGQLWKESYFWQFPYYLVAAAIANIFNTATTSTISFETALTILPILYLAYRYYSVQKTHLEEKEKHAGNMAALHLRAIEGLALAVEAKDNLNTRGHLRRVQVYALGIAKEMGLKGEELEALHAGALLHDVGKLAVPEHILTKPGKLTPEEFSKMKVHPLVGAEIVEQVQFPYPVAPIVRAHHEKWDGTGYPFGLKGEEIPLAARILTAVDCLDALRSDREYRRGLSLHEAMDYIVSESGKCFDPKVIDVLQRRYRELDQIARDSADEPAALSSNVKIQKGESPDAGLDLCSLSGLGPGAKSSDFLNTISAASREGKQLLEMAQAISSSLDLQETLQRVEDALRPMVPSDAMAVFLQQGNRLLAQHTAGDNKRMLASLEAPAGDGLIGWVAQNHQPVVNGNPTVDPGFSCEQGKTLKAALAVPIEGAGGVLGVIALYRREPDAFTRDNLRLVLEAAPKIATAIENALKYREMEVQSNTDPVTGLANAQVLMKSLESELGRSVRQRQPLTLLIAKLSGLSSMADPVLQAFAKGLKESCRDYDHLARMGDDSFAMVLPGMRQEYLGGKLRKLDSILAAACRQYGNHTPVRVAVGEAFYPHDADKARLLLTIAQHRADQHTATETESILALKEHTSAAVAEMSPVLSQQH